MNNYISSDVVWFLKSERSCPMVQTDYKFSDSNYIWSRTIRLYGLKYVGIK